MGAADHPIGVFDSGVGGLSVLRALHHGLPHENWVYYADSAHAPYGEKSEAFVVDRTLSITQHLRERHAIKAVVVACNTATAAAIAELRLCWPDFPIVGIEPGLKPAVVASLTHRIGVMATRRTIESDKFRRLLASLEGQAQFEVQPCDGLAHAIETGNQSKTEALISQYTGAMGHFGSENNAIDTLVLGCTHYPLVAQSIQRCVGDSVGLIDPGEGIARQLHRLLAQHQLLSERSLPGQTVYESSGSLAEIKNTLAHLTAK